MKKFVLSLCLMICCMFGFSQGFHHTYHPISHHSTYRPVTIPRQVHRSATHRFDKPTPNKNVQNRRGDVARPMPSMPSPPPMKPSYQRGPYRGVPIYSTPYIHPIQLINGLLWYVTIQTITERNTYIYDGHEYKLCPICHKTLIPLDVRTCHSCEGQFR